MKYVLLSILLGSFIFVHAQNVGIGTATPSSKLDVNGNLTIGNAYISTAAPTNGAIIQGNVGIGIPAPATNLDVIGAQYIRDNAVIGSVGSGMKLTNAGNANYIESAGAGMTGGADLNFTSMNAAAYWMTIKSSGKVGIGTGTGPGPSATLSVSAVNGNELGGTATSTTLRTFSGILGATANSSLKLASFGSDVGNQASLGFKALRTSATSPTTPSWYAVSNPTVSFGLQMDVDASDAVGGAVWFYGGNIGIGSANTTPASLFSVGTGSPFQVDGSGNISKAAAITASGAITLSTLGSGLVKANASGVLSNATGGTDYQTPLIAGTAISIVSGQINNTGVTSITAGNGLIASSTTGGVTLSAQIPVNYVGFIPNLASNNDWRGITVSASSTFSTAYQPWEPMSGAVADWATAAVTSNFWIQVQFPTAIAANRMGIRGRSTAEVPKDETISGSNDGVTWTQLYTGNTILTYATGNQLFTFTNDNFYKYYRVTFAVGVAPNPGLSFLQFYRF